MRIALNHLRLGSVFFLCACCGLPRAAGAQPAAAPTNLLQKVTVPTGFEVSLFAAPPNVGYPTCLAAAPTGELFVGVDENGSIDAKPERGRVVRCIDSDGDGQADQFNTFASMDSPRGLWFDHKTLYVMHPPFIKAFTDEDGDGVADRSEILVSGLGFDLKFRGADHTVNGMRMGIDGFLYIAVGDYGAIRAVGKDGTELQFHGGGVVRVRPSGTGLEIVSRGQRNIYDVAVSPTLDLFTRDNTNDGDGWNVRLSHVIATGRYGYPRLFKHFPDEIVQPLADYGGGSPCGALYLDEPDFPDGFGTALYTCDWGRSIVYRHPLTPKGASFTAAQSSFVNVPRPTDMDVDGEGRLYISSWSNGGFVYSGPNVGFVIRLVPADHRPKPFPQLDNLSAEQLVELLRSASAVQRLHVQRAILRRGPKSGVASDLFKLAAATDVSHVSRVAAVFTLAQLRGPAANRALKKLAKKAALREFALRAMADNQTAKRVPPTGPFLKALSDEDPRVRLQAATALGRLQKEKAAPKLLSLSADPDPLVSHAAIQALISLEAADVCLATFESPGTANLVPGAARVLQSLHTPEVVTKLIDRLNSTPVGPTRKLILTTLCRLHNREANWDGKWWGTRPDTRGPYFKSVTWEASPQVANVLRTELQRADKNTLRWLIGELRRHQVDLPAATAVVLKHARQDAEFRTIAVELLSRASDWPPDALPVLTEIATSSENSAALRAKAIRALHRNENSPERRDTLVNILASAGDDLAKEISDAWIAFARDVKHGKDAAHFSELTRSETPAKRVLAYGVLVSIEKHKKTAAEARALAGKTIEEAWTNPTSTLSLLGAIIRLRDVSFAHQVRGLVNASQPEVRALAVQAMERLGLDVELASESGESLIESLSYDEVVTAATAAAAATKKGGVKRGQKLFLTQGCAACHTVSADETPKGPFLGGIATRYSQKELCESILKPNAKIAQGFETQWFRTASGDELEGFVVREAGDEVDVRNILGITTTLAKSKIEERGKRDTSAMPAGLTDKLTPEDLAALLAYLGSLKSQ